MHTRLKHVLPSMPFAHALLMRFYHHRYAYGIRAGTIAVMFALASAVLGTSIFVHFTLAAQASVPSASAVSLVEASNAAMLEIPPQTQPIDVAQVNINQGVIAAHSVQLTNLQMDVTANKTAIAEQTNRLTEAVLKEALDVDKLAAQQSLDEGRVIAGAFVLGIIWTIGLAVLGFFHFGDRRKTAAA